MTDEPATPLEVQERLHKDLTKMCNEYNTAHIVGLPPSLNDEIYTISFAKYLNECVSTYEWAYIKNGRAPTDEEIHKLNEYYKSTLDSLAEDDGLTKEQKDKLEYACEKHAEVLKRSSE